MRVCVTGASGFIGRATVSHFEALGHEVKKLVRTPTGAANEAVLDGSFAGLGAMLEGQDAIVHLAGRAHVLTPQVGDAEVEFRTANVDLTRNLAQAAMKAGVARFVFISTVGIYGDAPFGPVNELSEVCPIDPYSRSKWEAEKALTDLPVSWTILRPPVVYGQGAPGNLGWLCRLIKKRRPLPLALARGPRTLISRRSLVDAIVLAANSSLADRQAFVLGDSTPMTSAELATSLSRAMGREPRLVSVPPTVAFTVAKLLGREKIAQRLFGSFVVDSTLARTTLGWTDSAHAKDDLLEMASETT